jgi:hypothetical protein
MNAPVWSHTITGAGVLGGGSVTQIFSFRQSSVPAGAPVPPISGHETGVVALITDGDQGALGWGGLQRLAPAVEAA